MLVFFVPSNPITGKILYEWMRLITNPNYTGRLLLYSFTGGSENLIFDFRRHIHHRNGDDHFTPVGLNDIVLREGSYILFGQDTNMEMEYIGIDSLISIALLKLRKPTRSHTATTKGTPSTDRKRSSAVRTKVRQRDFRCLVTGMEPQERPRGDNFTGLEVAHIFALADTSPQMLAAMRTNIGNFPEHLISSRTVADHPRNAIVLRSDVHAFFDDYQFSIDWRHPYRIYSTVWHPPTASTPWVRYCEGTRFLGPLFELLPEGLLAARYSHVKS
ncbi:hypothetical protein A0H81_07560 [Grifola frondosa]|uniref:HNH nuclease domain-containing protein n=1 Tax=Grifola frondosa TaxID=5627 RepID=A0A1C7M7J5_GRIFR|nr:hypothetical protein A0H81_07560 [Grifola frondosa]